MYTDAAHTSIFFGLCGLWVLSEFIGPVRWSGLRAGSKRDRGLIPVLIIFGSLGLLLCFFFPVLWPVASLPRQPAVFFVGCAVALIGMGWRWYAINTLGHYFTATLMTHPGQRVVQHGPYRFIRHPSYSGVLLIVIGLGLMLGNWASFVLLTGGMTAILLERIPKEEQELLLHLGQPYQDYMQRTKRLIPFVF